jgi:hypothetical protein
MFKAEVFTDIYAKRLLGGYNREAETGDLLLELREQ